MTRPSRTVVLMSTRNLVVQQFGEIAGADTGRRLRKDKVKNPHSSTRQMPRGMRSRVESDDDGVGVLGLLLGKVRVSPWA